MSSRRTIRAKVLAASATIAGLLVVHLLLTVVSLRSLMSVVSVLSTARLPNTNDVANAAEAQARATRALEALANDQYQGDLRADLYRQADAALRGSNESWAAFEARAGGAGGEVVAALKDPWAAWRTEAEKVLALEKERDRIATSGTSEPMAYRDATSRIRAELLAHRAAYDALAQKVTEVRRWTQDVAAREGEQAVASGRVATVVLTVAVLLLIGASVGVGAYLSQNITAPVRTLGGRPRDARKPRHRPRLACSSSATTKVRDELIPSLAIGAGTPIEAATYR